ncbi:hypothetical protein CHARACLAT_028754 [Characodon lateralis]|uniref:Uncharacterized protein n=1 Tax=Characodon lateralis TaxID=208331 RepID=A0ABU7DV14_9TELE|nr:hypothetical protein [Characodon lateralis]
MSSSAQRKRRPTGNSLVSRTKTRRTANSRPLSRRTANAGNPAPPTEPIDVLDGTEDGQCHLPTVRDQFIHLYGAKAGREPSLCESGLAEFFHMVLQNRDCSVLRCSAMFRCGRSGGPDL